MVSKNKQSFRKSNSWFFRINRGISKLSVLDGPITEIFRYDQFWLRLPHEKTLETKKIPLAILFHFYPEKWSYLLYAHFCDFFTPKLRVHLSRWIEDYVHKWKFEFMASKNHIWYQDGFKSLLFQNTIDY